MKRILLALLIILAVLFSYITYQKQNSSDKNLRTSNISKNSDQKENIRNFWEHFRKATRHRIEGNWELAIMEYKTTLEINGQHEDALFYLGNMYLETGEYREAEKIWFDLLKQNPKSGKAYFQLGNLYLNHPKKEFFDIEKAAAAFRKTFEMNKEETGSLLHIGEIFLIGGEHEKAQNCFSAVIGSNFKSVEAHFLNGYIFWKKGESDLALNSLKQAVEYSRSEKSANGVLGEGDTKEEVFFTRSVNQSIFYIHLNELWSVSEKDLSIGLDIRYSNLDRFIVEVREQIK